MGEIHQLLLYYGNGQRVFADCINAVSDQIAKGEPTKLCELLAYHGSDKGVGGSHNYSFLYNELSERLLSMATHMFELGVGSVDPQFPCNMGSQGRPGASLRAWRDRLPNTAIYGADIDRSALFQEPGIQTLYVDQCDPASVASLWNHIPTQFDAIIDDGLHTFEGNSVFLDNSLHALKENGVFIIEDILMTLDNIKIYDAHFNASGLSGFFWRMPRCNNTYDNGIAVLTPSHFMTC